MKKVFAIIAITLLLPVMTFAAEFWGSKNSNKYHYPNCQWAQKIKLANLVTFSNPEEAKEAGYVACKVCNPPAESKVEMSDQNILVAGLNPSEEKQGCCSWHGGVCGCQWGRAVCCDGTLSPTCGCD